MDQEKSMSSRRSFIQSTLSLGAGIVASAKALVSSTPQDHQMQMGESQHAAAPKAHDSRTGQSLPVETPDVPPLSWHMVDGAKEFRLVAEPVKRRLIPSRDMEVWGYNGSCPGPTIQVNQGDRIRIIFENRLPESSTIHWHGLEVPIEMDGLPYISQKPVPPGGKFAYEFTLHQAGTFFYHSHGAMQEMMGMIGLFIIHPAKSWTPRVDHDFGIVLQEWAILPNSNVPNTSNMEFNWLTFNGKAAPDTTPLVVRHGSRVRIRLVNLGMDHHPIHLHGNTFFVTGTEAGRQPEERWGIENTVLVGVAQARDIEFEAKYLGDWMLHCHLPHHMMNSMSDLIGDRMMTTMQLEDKQALMQMQTFADNIGVEHIHHAPIAPDANKVPGFPQDAFMEMGMDKAVYRPENYGLPPNWSANVMGMMALVRVVKDDLYEKIMAMKARGEAQPPGQPEHTHEHPHG
jgi:FtsP/CotA-like multicopper oxidase with cupredoxin domain